MPFSMTHANINNLWAALMFEELNRLGVTHCCLSPGSRSAPLVMAAAAHSGLETLTHYDERGLGYLALGLAKATLKPVTVVTTSGTAVANLYPAVIEAASSGVPLIVLSADRPPELLNCGANQAIDQNRLFGGYPRYFINLPCPTQAVPAAVLLTTIDQALGRCYYPEPGPVHLNLMLRDPLYPADHPRDFSDYLRSLGNWLESDRPYSTYRGATATCPAEPQSEDWQQFCAGAGLVIAGRLGTQQDANAVAELAMDLGWPLLADIQSGLRFGAKTLGYYDLLLNHPGFQQKLDGLDRVLQLGGRLTSKRLSAWLGSRTWQEYWFVDGSLLREDPQHQLSRRIQHPIAAFCQRARALLRENPRPLTRLDGELQDWNRQLDRHLEQWLGEGDGLNEIVVARTITQRQPKTAALVAGNSLPIRLLDMFAAGSTSSVSVYANRGASGIDGILAMAAGCALGEQVPVTLLIGDLSLLHDLNSLGLLRQLQQTLVVVVLNNDGGGIFRMLPAANQDSLLERFFQLPHGLSFANACEMFTLDYACPPSKQSFADCYTLALRRPRATVIEVKIPPRQTTDMIKAFNRRINTLRFSP